MTDLELDLEEEFQCQIPRNVDQHHHVDKGNVKEASNKSTDRDPLQTIRMS